MVLCVALMECLDSQCGVWWGRSSAVVIYLFYHSNWVKYYDNFDKGEEPMLNSKGKNSEARISIKPALKTLAFVFLKHSRFLIF